MVILADPKQVLDLSPGALGLAMSLGTTASLVTAGLLIAALSRIRLDPKT